MEKVKHDSEERLDQTLDLPRTQLDIDDYLSASADASSRTRAIMVVLVVASVLATTGLFNSLQTQWMHDRMIELGNPNGDYMTSKIGPAPTLNDSSDKHTYTDQLTFGRASELYKKRQEALCAAIENAYVESSLVIKVPFFGFTFDVNDLGLVSSLGFLLILSCYRFFLARELDNLRLAFTEAKNQSYDHLQKFYKLLAMRQVFTIPKSGYIRRSKFLLYSPKVLTWVPASLVLAIFVHDLLTIKIGRDLKFDRFVVEELSAFGGLVVLTMLSVFITQRLLWMDDIWDTVYETLNPGEKASRGSRALSWERTFQKFDNQSATDSSLLEKITRKVSS